MTLALGLLSALVLFRNVDLARQLLAFVEWLRSSGLVGVLSFCGVYVAATLLLLPASLLTVGSAFVWGIGGGLAVSLPAATLAATAAFLLGRTVARKWVQQRAERSPRLRAFDQSVAKGGLRFVMLVRLSPLFPFNLVNYALGLTRVSLRDYVVGSIVGMAPGTLLYVYIGSVATNAQQLLSGELPAAGPAGVLLHVAGAAASIGVLVWARRSAGSPGVGRPQ